MLLKRIADLEKDREEFVEMYRTEIDDKILVLENLSQLTSAHQLLKDDHALVKPRLDEAETKAKNLELELQKEQTERQLAEKVAGRLRDDIRMTLAETETRVTAMLSDLEENQLKSVLLHLQETERELKQLAERVSKLQGMPKPAQALPEEVAQQLFSVY